MFPLAVGWPVGWRWPTGWRHWLLVTRQTSEKMGNFVTMGQLCSIMVIGQAQARTPSSGHKTPCSRHANSSFALKFGVPSAPAVHMCVWVGGHRLLGLVTCLFPQTAPQKNSHSFIRKALERCSRFFLGGGGRAWWRGTAAKKCSATTPCRTMHPVPNKGQKKALVPQAPPLVPKKQDKKLLWQQHQTGGKVLTQISGTGPNCVSKGSVGPLHAICMKALSAIAVWQLLHFCIT